MTGLKLVFEKNSLENCFRFLRVFIKHGEMVVEIKSPSFARKMERL